MQIINIFVSLVIAGVGIWGGYKLNSKQNSYNIKLEELKNQMNRKGRIFEDKYFKTIDVLEKLGNFQIKLDDIHSYIRQVDFSQTSNLIKFNKVIEEFVDVRNDFVQFSLTRRYWLGYTLFGVVILMKEKSEQICKLLKKVYDKNSNLRDSATSSGMIQSQPGHLNIDDKEFIKLLDDFFDLIHEFEIQLNIELDE
ncbi:hypothetical protein JEZ13_04975 [bacterium]|nr:hypothetical protein [bacterium]